MKKLLFILPFLLIAATAYAAPGSRIERNIVPEANQTYELGTTSLLWLTVYSKTASTSALTISGLGSGSTQCLQIGGTGIVSGTNSACGAGGGGGTFPFTVTTNFNQAASATSTQLFLQGSPISLSASTTAWFDQTNVGSTTSGTMATSTYYGNLDVKGNLENDTINNAIVVDSTGGTLIAYTGTSCINQFVRSLNALGAATCATVANTDLSNSSVTLNTAGNLGGGGTVSLGNTLNLTCANCNKTWEFPAGFTTFITPTTTVGINVSGTLAQASSTISFLNVTNSTTTQATTTTLSATTASSSALTISGLGNGSTQCLQINGQGAVAGSGAGCGGSGSPGGADAQIQFNDGGSTFNGAGNLIYKKVSGDLGLGTSTPNWVFQVASTTPAIALTDTTPTIPLHALIINNNGSLVFATSSPLYTATTTLFSLNNNGTLSLASTSQDRPAGAVNGSIQYQTGTSTFEYRQGGKWVYGGGGCTFLTATSTGFLSQAAATTSAFSAFPILDIWVRLGTTSGNTWPQLVFNNDFTAVYDGALFEDGGGRVGYANATGTKLFNTIASGPATSEIKIWNFNGQPKTIVSIDTIKGVPASGNNYAKGAGAYNVSGQITSVALRTADPTMKLAASSTVAVYGCDMTGY